MKLPNHLAGGTLLTAILSSLSCINVFNSLTSIITMLVATTLPDIDLPKSTIGRTFKPISQYINRRWGHRTITHSFITLLILTLFLAMLEKQITDQNTLSLVFFYAYLSHLLLDMVTLMGVPLLYPFSKNPFVLPGNPRYRIRTGDIRAETIAFCLFILLSIFLRPLFQQGFWTSYNRLFGTMKHLVAEFKKADDLLEVEYFGKVGTQAIQGKGLCIEADLNRAILVEEEGFVVLEKNKMIIDKVLPVHTGRPFTFTQIPLIAVTVDSLNSLLHDQWIRSIELSAEQPFRVITDGIPSEVKRFKSELITSIWFQELEIPPDPVAKDSFIYQPNPRIPILRQRLQHMQSERLAHQQAWREQQLHIEDLKQAVNVATSFLEKERLYAQLVAAQKVTPPRIDLNKEAILLTEIQQLQRAERLKNEEQRLKAALLPADDTKATLLSGYVTLLHF